MKMNLSAQMLAATVLGAAAGGAHPPDLRLG